MKDLQYVILEKEHFDGFISRLSSLQRLVAPVARGYNNYAFEGVTSGDQIALNYIPTILPPKKYFLPQEETLLEYSLDKGLRVDASVTYENMVLFGVHTCDLAGIQCLNMVFFHQPKDYNYLVRKNSIHIIALECTAYCDDHASCSLVNASMPSGGYDLFFTDMGPYFIVHINTQAGDKIIETTNLFERADKTHLLELVKLREQKSSIFRNELSIDPRNIPALFDRSFDSPVWKTLGDRCLACGNCTNVCPTCYCFNIVDEMNLDLKGGKRYRRWDSCQLEPFAKVAGGENFRKERSVRQRHRYYRKFRYPVPHYSRFFCTGCGRCTRTCMAGISLKETLSALIEEGWTEL